MLTSNYAAFLVDFLRELDDRLPWELLKTGRAHDSAPVHEAEAGGSLSKPVFVCNAGTVPDDAGMLDVEFFGEPVHAKESEMRDVVDVRHDQQSSNIIQFCTIFRKNTVSVEVVKESFNNAVGFGDMHPFGVEFLHLRLVKPCKVWPSSLQDEFVDIDRRRRGCIR